MPFNHDYIELNNIIAATRLGVTAEEQSKIQDIVDNQKIKCPICNADKMNYNYYMFLSVQSVTCNVM